MTDPTGRHHDEIPSASAEPLDPDAPLPTDRGLHPLAAIPRPFTREQLESREQAIKDGILRMGSMVAEQMLAAIDALERHDAEAATAVVDGDDAINQEQQRVAALVAQSIIRDQPVARDLRFLMALDHAAYDLERMGDHAANVAKQARKLAPLPPLDDYLGLPELGRAVAQQVRDILSAIVDVDQERARTVARADDAIDDMYHRLFARALEAMRADPANVDPGTRIIFAAHYIERTGDRVTDIAEDVVYLATGAVEELN
jgi:phosphate transport system protein